MLLTALNFLECFFLLMLNAEAVLSDCDVRVLTIDLGCHLEWNCTGAKPNTTFTVTTKTRKKWNNVSDCIHISKHSCDLSHVFPNINIINFIRLRSEDFPQLNGSLYCDPTNDPAARFSRPSITISMGYKRQSVWVNVKFPCAPCISCSPDGYYEDEDEEGQGCCCPLNQFKRLSATVILYNNQTLSDRQTHTAAVMQETPFKVEFGLLTPGQVYCAVANFTAEDVTTSSPASVPQCVSIPASTGNLINIIVGTVVITLCVAIFLLWKWCKTSEHLLPRSLASLRDLDLQKETELSTVAPHEISEGDYVSVVSLRDLTLTINQSYFNSESLGSGYYTSTILHNPDCTEESVESTELSTEVQSFNLILPQPALEAKLGCPYQNLSEKISNIPLSSVQVKCTQQEDTDPCDVLLRSDA